MLNKIKLISPRIVRLPVSSTVQWWNVKHHPVSWPRPDFGSRFQKGKKRIRCSGLKPFPNFSRVINKPERAIQFLIPSSLLKYALIKKTIQICLGSRMLSIILHTYNVRIHINSKMMELWPLVEDYTIVTITKNKGGRGRVWEGWERKPLGPRNCILRIKIKSKIK